VLKDAGIRKVFCAALRDEIAVGWKERGPVSSDSQSTEPSADERPDTISPENEGVQSLLASLKRYFATSS